WSWPSCSRPLRRLPLCGAAWGSVLFPPLLLLRAAGCGKFTLAGDRLDPRNVLAQTAHLLQTFCLTHAHLELQLEKLVLEIALLALQLLIGQVPYFFCLHKFALSFRLSAFSGPSLLMADS